MSRRPDEQGSIFSCQATLPRAGTYFLNEPNAARQALLHGTDPWLALSSAIWATSGCTQESVRVHDIPRAQCFVPSF